jgi:hypothetical protein
MALSQDSVDSQNPGNANGAEQTNAPTQSAASFVSPPAASAKKPVESEITVEGLASYGNYRIFASSTNCKIYYAGIEYDRHSWGRFLGAQMDYVGEFEPIVLLNQPTVIDLWGITKTTTRKTVPGMAILPIGFRWLWFDKKPVKFYLGTKAGVIGFTQKAPASDSSYENFTLQSSLGLQVRMTQRVDLRLGLFGDFHFSNGFVVPINPGLDVMNASMGITYHLGSGHRRAQ